MSTIRKKISMYRVRYNVLAAVEDLSDIESHLCFLVGTGNILDLANDGTERDAHFGHRLCVQHI